MAIKAINHWLAIPGDRTEFAALVFKDRADAGLSQAIRFAESGKAAPGDLHGAGPACQPEVTVAVFGLRSYRTIA